MAYDGTVRIDTKMDNDGIKKGVGDAEKEFSRFQSTLAKIKGALRGCAYIGGAAIGSLARGMGKLFGASMTAYAGIRKVMLNILTLGMFAKKTSGVIASLTSKLFHIAASAFVFNVLSRGFLSLSEQLRNTMAQSSAFAASWNTIKVNLLTAFAPIWEVIQPALIVFMNVLATVTGYLARFMALLFGKTVAQARDSAKALGSQAKGIGGVGKAAKDAKGELASFDKLNKSSADNSGGGSGGGSDGGGGGLDWNVDEPKNIGWLDTLAEKLKTIFNIADPSYWKNFGTFISDNIANALNKINWSKIQEAARIFAINVASAMSGFFANPAMWEAVGNTLAQGFNTLVTFLGTLVSTFDWKGYGSALAAGFETLIKNIDFAKAGKFISDGIKGIHDSMLAFLGKIDWKSFGAKFGEFINAIDWVGMMKRLGATIGETFKAVLNSLTGFIAKVNWKQIGESIRSFLAGIDWMGIIKSIGGVIGSAFSGAFDFLTGLVGSPIATVITVIATAIGSLVAAMVTWKAITTAVSIAQGILNAVMNANPFVLILSAIVALGVGIYELIKHWDKVKEVALKVWEAIKNVWGAVAGWFKSKVLDPVVNFFKNMFESVINWVKSNWKSIVLFIVNPFAGVFKYFYDNFSWFRDFVNNILTAVAGFFRNAWTGIKSVWDAVPGFFKNIWNGIVSVFQSVHTWFSEKFKNAWLAIQNAWASTVTWFKGVKDGITTAFSTIHSWFTTKFTDAWNGIKGIWDNAKTYFSGVYTGIQSVYATVHTWFKQKFDDAWTNTKNAWASAKSHFSGIKTDITNAYATIHTWFGQKFGEAWTQTKTAFADGTIKTYFSGVWSNIKGAFGSISDWFKTEFSNAWGKVKEVFSSGGQIFDGIKDGILNGLKAVINALISGINKVIKVPFDGINTALNKIKNVDIAGIKPFSWIKEISIPQIPQLAKGGIVDSSTIAEIGEKGREAVVPLERNTGWMDELAKKINELNGGGRGGSTTIILEVDRREFGRAVVELGDSERERRGARIQPRAVLA